MNRKVALVSMAKMCRLQNCASFLVALIFFSRIRHHLIIHSLSNFQRIMLFQFVHTSVTSPMTFECLCWGRGWGGNLILGDLDILTKYTFILSQWELDKSIGSLLPGDHFASD